MAHVLIWGKKRLAICCKLVLPRDSKSLSDLLVFLSLSGQQDDLGPLGQANRSPPTFADHCKLHFFLWGEFDFAGYSHWRGSISIEMVLINKISYIN